MAGTRRRSVTLPRCEGSPGAGCQPDRPGDDTTPASPGDSAGSIAVFSSDGHTTTIPVTLRSLIEPQQGGTFQGVLTGGNGRDLGEGPDEFYEFNVGQGVKNITASVSLATIHRTPSVST